MCHPVTHSPFPASRLRASRTTRFVILLPWFSELLTCHLHLPTIQLVNVFPWFSELLTCHLNLPMNEMRFVRDGAEFAKRSKFNFVPTGERRHSWCTCTCTRMQTRTHARERAHAYISGKVPTIHTQMQPHTATPFIPPTHSQLYS